MHRLHTFKLNSFYDELLLSCARIEPEQPPKAVVQLVHGMKEHKQRYLPFMQFLAANGYASVIHDERGHGGSVKQPEDLGYFYEGGVESFIQDIDTVNSYIHENWPGLPVILLGHSMGSLAVRCYAARYDDRISALLILGTPAETPALRAAVTLNGADILLHGPRHKSAGFNKTALGLYQMPFIKEKKPLAWLNSDRAAVDLFLQDDLCNFAFTADGWSTLFDLMQAAFDVQSFHCTNHDLPVLFLSGEDDPCHSGHRGFYAAAGTMVKAGYRHVKTRLYPGMRHEILLEPERHKVFSDILAFLKKNGL